MPTAFIPQMTVMVAPRFPLVTLPPGDLLWWQQSCRAFEHSFHILVDVYMDISSCDLYSSKNWCTFGWLNPTFCAMLVLGCEVYVPFEETAQPFASRSLVSAEQLCFKPYFSTRSYRPGIAHIQLPTHKKHFFLQEMWSRRMRSAAVDSAGFFGPSTRAPRVAIMMSR